MDERDIQMMGNADLWPAWPWLPLVSREPEESGDHILGLLPADGTFLVSEGNLFAKPAVRLNARTWVYATAEDLLSEWRVD